MSDSDENIMHVFDQTNGVLDGFEGESDGTSEAAAAGAAERRGDAGQDRTPGAADSAVGTDDGVDHGGRPSTGGVEHAFAVDAGGTATETDDLRPAAGSGGGAHVATAADTAPSAAAPSTTGTTATQRSEVADPPAATTGGTGTPTGDDDSVAHVFDQTNGVVDGIEGESDGTAAGDQASSADRTGLNEPNPVGQQDAWREDHYGAEDGRDRNP